MKAIKVTLVRFRPHVVDTREDVLAAAAGVSMEFFPAIRMLQVKQGDRKPRAYPAEALSFIEYSEPFVDETAPRK